LNDLKVRESQDQNERLKSLDYDLSRTAQRIDDTQKLVDARNYDLRNKQLLLEDSQKELARFKDTNGRVSGDNGLVRRDIDKLMAEAYDLRKEVDYQQARNIDISG
jgi:chromosome segregation ATPase